ncbi:general substrate transporter [Cucurbitaria berberidis CBS 394.84]|uniref:General substrate transporter n=1 Tax=Cucurbitaria berberidis CBS 394.84 TaxID=1168544 RepID=A0A9P4G933_9PLEO|nr:general substrate transporter [Cucurbitaria berberidis CBS 394.84]KAF1841291.1 general substrate transporter [Cucurbitaria berberidis CBS 394.84]
MAATICNLAPMSYDGNLVNSLRLFKQFINYYNLDESMLGLHVAIVSAGSFFVGPFAGEIIDRVGRRNGMFLGSFFSIISVVVQVATHSVAALLVGRFLLGVAIVISVTASTSMATELAHPKHRGLLVGSLMSLVFLFNIPVNIIGIFIYTSPSNWAWRGLVMGEGLLPVLSIPFIFLLEESPRYLIHRGKNEKALDILAKLHGRGNRESPLVREEFEEIRSTLEYEKLNEAGWLSLIKPIANFKRFCVACLCAIFSQITGAYTIPYFQTLIIGTAGITSTKQVFLLSLGISIWVWISMMIGSALTDRIGRKPVLIGGTCVMTLCLAVMAGLGYGYEDTGRISYGIGSVLMLFIFMGAMATSWLLLAYVYPPEILKFSQRAKGVSISQALGYAFSCMNQYTLPIAIKHINWRYYAIVASFNVVIIVTMWVYFPESKGMSLEELDQVFEGVVHHEGIGIDGIQEAEADADRKDASLQDVKSVGRTDQKSSPSFY